MNGAPRINFAECFSKISGTFLCLLECCVLHQHKEFIPTDPSGQIIVAEKMIWSVETGCLIRPTVRSQGKKKLTFERFVQSAYLDWVLRAANVRLLKMSDERYQLVRKEEADRKNSQTGLDLEVLDQWTGKNRNVRSLSGGESFKAALSLALGLSDVIQSQKGGIQIDTISLMKDLELLTGSLLPGQWKSYSLFPLTAAKWWELFTHVEELKNQIDQKIQVTRGKEGSQVNVVY